MTEAKVQLWQLSSSSSLAITAQLHQQHSNLQQFQLRQPCSRAAMQPCSLTALQHESAAWQPQATALQLYSLTVLRSQCKASKPEIPTTALQPSHQTKASMSFQKRSFAATARHVLVLRV